jgi:secreted trypsin-like serine protease
MGVRLGLLAVVAALALPITSAGAASPRVVGGKPVAEGSFAAVANVSLAGAFECTGTLIAPDWVLTAGHCGSLTSELIATPIAFPPFFISVTLGTIHSDGSGGTPRGVTEIRIPPQHFGLSTDAGYDVSLLHLSAPAPQKPVLIAGKGEEPLWSVGRLETIVGFGLTSENASAGPELMQQAQVPIVADAACGAIYSATFEAATQICAGYPQGGVDTCNGDSGGPMFATAADGSLRIVGVTSYGNGCARPNAYGVYGRAADATLRGWIGSIVPPAIAPDYVAPPPVAQQPVAKQPVKKKKPAKHAKKKHKKHKKHSAKKKPSKH